MLLAANADVNVYVKVSFTEGFTPIEIACHHGHLAVVQILSAYGARRGFRATPIYAGARRHRGLAAWLGMSYHWTALHHVEFLSPEHALELLRRGDKIDVAAKQVPPDDPIGPAPLELARALAAAGGAAGGGVPRPRGGEAVEPERQVLPEPARARARRLLRVGQWFGASRATSDPVRGVEVFVMPPWSRATARLAVATGGAPVGAVGKAGRRRRFLLRLRRRAAARRRRCCRRDGQMRRTLAAPTATTTAAPTPTTATARSRATALSTTSARPTSAVLPSSGRGCGAENRAGGGGASRGASGRECAGEGVCGRISRG